MVQLHGDEGPAFCAEVAGAPGAKVDQGRARSPSWPTSRSSSAFHTDYHLLDTHRAGVPGGTGETFDWELAHAAPLEGAADPQRRPDAEQRRPRRSPRSRRSPWTSPAGPRPSPGVKDPAKLRRRSVAAAGARRRRPAEARHDAARRAPLRPLRRAVRPRDADARAGRARGGVAGGARDPATAPSSTGCCATTPGARRRSTWPSACQRGGRPRDLAQARGPASTPARTRSTTRSARRCSRGAWASSGSSPRPAPASTASRPRRRARCSASSASSTWAPRTCAARGPTSSAWSCSAPTCRPVEAGTRDAQGGDVARRSATGSTNVATRTTSSARRSARRPTRRSCATCSA